VDSSKRWIATSFKKITYVGSCEDLPRNRQLTCLFGESDIDHPPSNHYQKDLNLGLLDRYLEEKDIEKRAELKAELFRKR